MSDTLWAERVQKAYDAWNHWTHLPGRFRMDRALKEAGVRGLIVARDEALAENERLQGVNAALRAQVDTYLNDPSQAMVDLRQELALVAEQRDKLAEGLDAAVTYVEFGGP